MNRTYWSKWKTTARESPRRKSRPSSVRSSQANRKDWEWAFRSAAPSLNVTAERFRRRIFPAQARSFQSRFRPFVNEFHRVSVLRVPLLKGGNNILDAAAL